MHEHERRERVTEAMAAVIMDRGVEGLGNGARVRALLSDALGSQAQDMEEEIGALAQAADELGVDASARDHGAVEESLAARGVAPGTAAWAREAWSTLVTDRDVDAAATEPPPAPASSAAVESSHVAASADSSQETGPDEQGESSDGATAWPIRLGALAGIVLLLAAIGWVALGNDGDSPAAGAAEAGSPTAPAGVATSASSRPDPAGSESMGAHDAMAMGPSEMVMPATSETAAASDTMSEHAMDHSAAQACAQGDGALVADVSMQTVSLSGPVGSAEQRDAIAAAAGNASGQVDVRSGLEVGASTVAPPTVEALTAVLPVMVDALVTGKAVGRGEELCVAGELIDDVARAQLARSIEQQQATGVEIEHHLVQHPIDHGLHVTLLEHKLNAVVADTTIPFVSGEATLLPEAAPILDELTGVLERFEDFTGLQVVVRGHTDDVGTAEANLALSQARAQAVVDALVQRDVDPSRLVAHGYGESEPIATNDTEEGRAENRRVDFRVRRD